MPQFDGFIYGNIPIEGEVTTDGEIEWLAVKGLKNENKHPVYLDYSDEERYQLQIKFAREISEAIADWYRGIRQEKKYGH